MIDEGKAYFTDAVKHTLRAFGDNGAMAGSIGERIAKRRRELGKSQEAIGRVCGVTKQAVGQWESGSSEPSGAHIVALARVLERSENWIITGKDGKPLVTMNDGFESNKPPARHTLVSGYRIAEMDIRASAGPGALVVDDKKIGEWELPRDLVRSATNSPAARLRVITIMGDSMEPMFRPNERVMVDTGDITPSPPGIFVVWDGLGLVAKRLEYIPHSDPPRVRIMSENPKYTPYERTLDEAYIQGRVLGKWQWT